MLSAWILALPSWLVVVIVLYGLAALYVAIRYREARKFLAGAFFVSSGILWYLWATGTSLPVVLPGGRTIAVESPAISGQRAVVHFVLCVLCFYFGFVRKPAATATETVNPSYPQLIRSSVVGTLALAALLFIPAGTFGYWQGWLYLVVFILCCGAYTVYLAKADPALLKRRSEGGVAHENEPTQKLVMILLYAACFVLVVLAPLDVRFGWSNVPLYVSVFGDALVVFSFYVFYLVSKANTYAAASIRVEAGQTVISTGLYGFVRHPMYLGALFLFAGTPLALGSWWGLLLLPPALAILSLRIANEETVLLRDLPGYDEYRRKVRYRLIPRLF